MLEYGQMQDEDKELHKASHRLINDSKRLFTSQLLYKKNLMKKKG